ncbi:MAG: hypothetical protein IPK82_21530 [Polyangiaceae bacterium]|nr:hypothetical protein [Polyangiaceae bacterium]
MRLSTVLTQFLVCIPIIGAAGCSLAEPILIPMCQETPEARSEQKQPSKPLPAHPDYEQLRALRNYYSVQSVEEYAHHFSVWFSCVESSTAHYTVSPSGEVRKVGGAWGGLATTDRKVDSVPPEQAQNAALVRTEHDRAYLHESKPIVVYMGSYRRVWVNEVVPWHGPGSPYKRMMNHMEVAFRANADLTSFDGYETFSGGTTKLCWEDLSVRDCSNPHWVDFTPSKSPTSLLVALASNNAAAPVLSEERQKFNEVVLAAARKKVAGEPGTPLADILTHQEATLLPTGYNPEFVIGFRMHAHPKEGANQKNVESQFSKTLLLSDIFKGSIKTTLEGQVAGQPVSADVTISVDPKPPQPQGEFETSLQFVYTIRAVGSSRSAELKVTAKVIVDGDRVALLWRNLPKEVEQAPHLPPLTQTFAGTGMYKEVESHFFLTSDTMPKPWYPPSR